MSTLADTIRAQLPEIGEHVTGLLVDLARDTSHDRIERALGSLRGAQHTLLRLRDELDRAAVPSQERGHGE